ncbi:protein of unknown function [Paraburkholderia dioscoreae]|uniref:Uncharacterized protein n=1 Tax=Paraburkholderia dioscoreae TaxID=2604047 RepID=A0A5Q4ZLK5_9BURK|nr:protein of unknown function [Paraburkholderia dioscoreae]
MVRAHPRRLGLRRLIQRFYNKLNIAVQQNATKLESGVCNLHSRSCCDGGMCHDDL